MLDSFCNKLNVSIEHLETLRVVEIGKFARTISKIDNDLYDILEYISELDAKNFNPQQKKEQLVMITRLDEQLDRVNKLFFKISSNYDNHYLDRAMHTLNNLSEDIDELKEMLKG